MVWLRLCLPRQVDPGTPAFYKKLLASVRRGGLRGDLRRWRAGFPVYHEGPLVDEEAARALGITWTERADPPAPVASPTVTALAEAWTALRGEWQRRGPAALSVLAPPLLADDLALAERALGWKIPDEVLALYALHDGQTDEPGPFHWTLDSLYQNVATWRFFDEADADFDGVRADAGIRRRAWHSRWLPLFSDGGGDHLCVDLDPAPGGSVGQIIHYHREADRLVLMAPSLPAWLDQVRDLLVRGQIEVPTSDDE